MNGGAEGQVVEPLARAAQLRQQSAPALAKVILLQPLRRGRANRSPDVGFLSARYGDRWTELPSDMGRDGAYAERLLADAPAGLRPERVAPTAAADTLRALVSPASTTIKLLRAATDTLSGVLGAPLDEVPLTQLRSVAAATVLVGSGPSPEPAWGDPSAAALAGAVLQLHGPLLASSRRLHDEVYATFTEHIWDLPAAKLERRRAAWPLVGVRRRLGAASRTGRAPKTRDAVRALREATDCRARIADAQSLLSLHLGAFDRGPMTDAARAGEALAAVTALHAALGDHLDARRLDGLLLADAFTDPEVAEPARIVQVVISAWAADAARAGGSRALDVTLTDLAAWLEDAPIAAALLDEAAAATAAAGQPATTVQGLVNDLLARQRIFEADDHARRIDGTVLRSS
jgi:hypothetical protein